MTKVSLGLIAFVFLTLLGIVNYQRREIVKLSQDLDFAGQQLAKEIKSSDYFEKQLHEEHMKKLKNKA